MLSPDYQRFLERFYQHLSEKNSDEWLTDWVKKRESDKDHILPIIMDYIIFVRRQFEEIYGREKGNRFTRAFSALFKGERRGVAPDLINFALLGEFELIEQFRQYQASLEPQKKDGLASFLVNRGLFK